MNELGTRRNPHQWFADTFPYTYVILLVIGLVTWITGICLIPWAAAWLATGTPLTPLSFVWSTFVSITVWGASRQYTYTFAPKDEQYDES